MAAESDHYSLNWLSHELRQPLARLQSLAARAERCYNEFTQERRGKKRLIDNPNDELKEVQSSIRDILLVSIPLSEIVHGCVKGRSAQTNAHEHVRQPSAASIDIRKCYQSITNRMVFRFFTQKLRLGPKVASILTRLTTRRGHLPTGAPTSDALANLILSPVDDDIERIAARLGLNKTRYVDNIDFSGANSGAAIGPTIQSLQRNGFAVPREKVFRAGGGKAHVISGHTVNGKRVSISQAHRNKVRAACHELVIAFRRGDSIVKMTKIIRGRITHVARTNPRSADKLRRTLRDAGISLLDSRSR